MPAPMALLKVAKNALAVVGLWDKLPSDAKSRIQEMAQTFRAKRTTRARLEVARVTAEDLHAEAEGARTRQRRRVKADVDSLFADLIEYTLRRGS